MLIVKELWTKEVEEPEVKNSNQAGAHRASESPAQRQALLRSQDHR